MVRCSVVILHYQNVLDTKECIESLVKDSQYNDFFQIIIVDNSKSIPLKSLIKKYPRIILIQNRENVGFAKGVNIGIKKALNMGSEFIILLNNDTLVGENLVPALVGYLKSNKRVGIVSPKIYFAKGYEFAPI